MKTKQLDVVYPVKKQNRNDELRYSLRSLSNMPHARVFIVGYRPSWVRNVEYIPNMMRDDKYTSVKSNIDLAVRDTRVSESFILMNDDYYVMKPIRVLKTAHKGSLAEQIKIYSKLPNRGAYLLGMINTYSLLKKLGIEEPLSYELHTPFIYDKHKKAEVSRVRELVIGDARSHLRTLYGNYWQLGGTKQKDVKLNHQGKQDWDGQSTFLSTNDDYMSGRTPGASTIMNRFNKKCKYEA